MQNNKILLITVTCVMFFARPAYSEAYHPWVADLGNAKYQNPIIFADYSDPDVVRVGDDFYMTASSFHVTPGLPILHSKDLVNWRLINHALTQLVPEKHFSTPQHGNGVWAPNIRYHDGKFWIFYPDPDFGIYLVTADDPAGQWSDPVHILKGKGLIDPTPLWDDDGQAYLLHGWAKSRAGINNILTLHKMSQDGLKVEKEGKIIIDANKIQGYRTLEGPKFYKRNGYYYIFAPAGGVPLGWQATFRSKNIEGPYEHRIAMDQGDTFINGPHQGSWVHTANNEDWFIHFQSHGAYGRIVHMQPMSWRDDWPVIGIDHDDDGIGNPVSQHTKPELPKQEIVTIPISDDFSGDRLGLQWQWNANVSEKTYSLSARKNHLRLYAQASKNTQNNMWHFANILAQKLPGPQFIVETQLEIPDKAAAMDAGLIMYGEDYAWIGVQHRPGHASVIGVAHCQEARKGCEESFEPFFETHESTITLRMTVTRGGQTIFSFLDDKGRFIAEGGPFQARPGRWVGARMGLFNRSNSNPHKNSQNTFIDVSYFKLIEPRNQ
jgi:beta-xylosidase